MSDGLSTAVQVAVKLTATGRNKLRATVGYRRMNLLSRFR